MNPSIGESDAWGRLESFKRELILDLFLRRGSFWEAIREARERRGITPVCDVPPPEYRAEPIRHNDEALRIHNEQIPEAHRRFFSFDWLGFVDMCLDFDPPGSRLDEFAAFGAGPFETRLLPEGSKLGPAGDVPSMVAPPVKKIRTPDGTARYEIAWEDEPTVEDARSTRYAGLRDRGAGTPPQCTRSSLSGGADPRGEIRDGETQAILSCRWSAQSP